MSAEAVASAVRVHADRVHDAVRRQGCPPSAAPGVVERTAVELVGRAARDGGAVPVLLGQWFAAAVERARGVAVGGPSAGPGAGPSAGEPLTDDALDTGPIDSDPHDAGPHGSGPLADDPQQRLLAGVLDGAPEPGRTALLLADAYDLPLPTVAAALDREPDEAATVLGRARLGVLPDLLPEVSVPSLAGHAVDEAGLTRLARGGQPAPYDTTTARHARACPRCRGVVEAQEDVRRLLAGLSVVALPDEAREALLERVGERARRLLPSEEELRVAAQEEEDEPPRRLLTPLAVLLSLGLAVVGGVGLGVLLSRPPTVDAAQVGLLPAVTPPPLTPLPDRRRTASPEPEPAPRVFTLRPTPTPTLRTTPPTAPPTTSPPSPRASASPTASPSARPADIEVDPTSGPAGATVVVSGTGWTPGSVVSTAYLQEDGDATGSTASAEVDDDGAFTARLSTRDRQSPTGEHTVLASDGTSEARATYDAQPAD